MNLSVASENINFFGNTNSLLSLFGASQNTAAFSAILISLAIILVFFALSKIISYAFKKYISKLIAITPTIYDDLITGLLSKYLPLFVLFAGLYLSMFYFTSYFLQEYRSFALLVVFLAFVFLVLRAFVELINIFLNRMCESSVDTMKKEKNQAISCDRTLAVYGTSISNFFMYLAFFLIMLSSFGIDVSIFVASLGILGLIVGLAAQATFSDFFSGLMLLIDRPFVIGDFIKVEDIEGQVLKISLRSTTIITKNNEEVIIPNSSITKANVVNYKKTIAHEGVRFEVNIKVAYDVDINVVKRIMLSVADKTERIFKNPKPMARLLGVSDSSLNFSLLFWCLYKDKHSLQDEVYTNLLLEFKKHKIEIK